MNRHRFTKRRFTKRVVAAGGAFVVGVAAVATAFAFTRSRPASGATPAPAAETAAAARRDLVDREAVSGTLGYGTSRDVASPRPGTVTAEPALGSVIKRGQSLFEIDGRGVPLLYGARPMWRALAVGVDDGPDLRQLEENLVALGVDANGITPNDHWDWRTTAAVKRWQKLLGLDQSGIVSVGDLVFLSGPARVDTRPAEVGSSAQPGGQPVITVTSAARVVSVRLDAAKRSLARVGEHVSVVLPSGTSIPATVTAVGNVATVDASQSGDGDSTAKIDVSVSLGKKDTAALRDLDATPVDVEFTRASAKGALAVPVRALTALAEGGYAVEIVKGAAHRLVPVELGAFADGWVAVTGEVHAGDRVVVSS